MPGCTVPYCTNSSQKGFKLYHFPSDVERSALWVKNCGREEGWMPTRHTCVCEVHFEETQFESHRADGLKKLKPYAVPTKFYYSNCVPKRRKKKNINNLSEEGLDATKLIVTGGTVSSPINTSNKQRSSIRRNITILGKKRYLESSNGICLNKSPGKNKRQAKVIHDKPRRRGEICFMCCENTQDPVPLNSYTTTTKARLDQKLIQLVAQEFDLLLEDLGMLCSSCAQVLNFTDFAENVFSTLSKGVLNCIRKKFGMDSAGEIDLKSYIKNLPPLQNFCSDKKLDSSELNKKEDIQNDEGNKKKQKLCGTLLECQLCSYKTNFKASMIYHLRQHLQTLYSCDFCCTPVILDSSNEKKVCVEEFESNSESENLVQEGKESPIILSGDPLEFSESGE